MIKCTFEWKDIKDFDYDSYIRILSKQHLIVCKGKDGGKYITDAFPACTGAFWTNGEGFWKIDQILYYTEMSELLKFGNDCEKLNELSEAKENLATAIKYLREGKSKFTPNTTNSHVDVFLSKFENDSEEK